MRKKLSAKELHELLLNSGIIGSTGKIQFTMSSVFVTIDTTDIVGHILQSWLKQWMIDKDIFFDEPKNTQVFPDFYLDDKDIKNNLLEVKAFNYDNSPAFDIANFESYCTSLMEDAYRLNADYLVFAYTMKKGLIKIENIWLKKIWQISSSSTKYPLRVQDKREIIYNIRPTKWYSDKAKSPFKSREDFVIALHDTLNGYEHTKIHAKKWIKKVMKNYKSHTTHSLDIKLK